jgi:hypothetical protein
MRTNGKRVVLGAVALCLCLMLVLAGVLYNGTSAAVSTMDCPNGPLSADLTGAAISGRTPAGMARFRERGNNGLMVNLRNVNVAANTALDVYIGETKVGTIEIGRGRSGQLRLDSTAATVDENTVITIRNGATTILTGTFTCVAGGPGGNTNANTNTNNTNSNNTNSNNANSNNTNSNNTNSNANSNSNANANANTNSNTNTNRNRPNRNTNRNGNTNSSPSPSPDF